MMTENNNPVVMTWFQQQQTPAGWFDLLIIMVEGMLNNAGELESQPFLRQMGASLAETHPLPASETVGDLEANINRLLTHFHWGVVTIDVGEDGLRLRQILLNLIGNAVQYTEQGGQITIAADTDKIWIENSCTPLTEEQLAYIYEPFYRVDDALAASGGNGLGLYVVRELLKKEGFRYVFEPVEDGMRFTIFL